MKNLNHKLNSKSVRERILNMFIACGGVTCDEVEEVLGLAHQNASARINELVHSGHLSRSNRQRRTRLGGWADILVPTKRAKRK